MNQINLIRTPTGYRNFIKAFRAFRNLPERSVLEVRDQESGRVFFFRMPNWKMFAYKLPEQNQQNLTSYQHYPHNMSTVPVGIKEINNAFAGHYQLIIDYNLSIVMFLTAEAARSEIIYLHFQEIFNSPERFLSGRGISWNNVAVLFHNNERTAKYLGYLNALGQHTPSWKPLTYEDYMHYFSSISDPSLKAKFLRELNKAIYLSG